MYSTTALCFLLCMLSAGLGQKTRYDGFSVWEVVPSDGRHVKLLSLLLHERSHELDFFVGPGAVGLPVSLLVPPKLQPSLGDHLHKHGLSVKVIVKDIQLIISEEERRLTQRVVKRDVLSQYQWRDKRDVLSQYQWRDKRDVLSQYQWRDKRDVLSQYQWRDKRDVLSQYQWRDFNTYESIMAEVRHMASDCPVGFTCSVYNIGSSLQGRNMTVLKVSRGSGRKAYWFDSLIHAREWLSGATLMKIMDRLIREYGSNKEATRLLDQYDFYFLPVMNPDGYKYTWGVDRMWRKSRSELGACHGTDLNRNYDYDWGGAGSSSNPCSIIYRGTHAASEVETQHVQNEAKRISRNLLAWISIHTYGRLVLVPFGSKKNGSCVYPKDNTDLLKVTNAFADAIEKVNNTYWRRGNVCDTIYPATGNTIDYMKAVAGVKYTFTPELRGPGFIVSPDHIQPSFDELWAGVVAMIDSIKETH